MTQGPFKCWSFYFVSQTDPEVRNVVQTQFGGEYFYVTEWVSDDILIS